MPAVHVHVFRRIFDEVEPLASERWEAFCAGQAPLPIETGATGATGGAKVEVLLITTRDGVCELVEPVSLHVDANGFLQRLHVRFEQLPRQPGLHDARNAFLDRYLRHANHWAPTPAQIEKALAYCAAHAPAMHVRTTDDRGQARSHSGQARSRNPEVLG